MIRRLICCLGLVVLPGLALAQAADEPDPTRNGPLIWDYNHDGVYTCDEWKRFADQTFSAADRNHDGFLDAREFPVVRKVDPAFAEADLGYFDDNNDGKVSRKEFVDKPSPFILRYDRNGDCRVTAEELKGMPAKDAPAARGRHGGGGGGMGGLGGGSKF